MRHLNTLASGARSPPPGPAAACALGAVLAPDACGAIRVYRKEDDPDKMHPNAEAFAACFRALERGHLIAIYPEGTTHAEARVRRIKSGAARIALGHEAARPDELSLVPVGSPSRRAGPFWGGCWSPSENRFRWRRGRRSWAPLLRLRLRLVVLAIAQERAARFLVAERKTITAELERVTLDSL